MSSELSTGKTIVILAVVIGCFAVLWPKVFYPMLTSSGKASSSSVGSFRDAANAHFVAQLCLSIGEHPSTPLNKKTADELECVEDVKVKCKVALTETNVLNYRLRKDKTALSKCLEREYQLTPEKISRATPPPVKSKPHSPSVPHPHTRPERPQHINTDGLHPALREKGRTLPHRTIEKQARPGPQPGIRPPMGGGGHMGPPQTKGTGTMSLIMPIYTVGIVVFFVYTIMKVLCKKGCDDDQAPKLKDFHLDPEYRKYIFAEEYLDNSNTSHRDQLRRHERETSKHRRRQEIFPDPKIVNARADVGIKNLDIAEDEQMDQLRRRLEETETAMERLMSQMGSVTDKLTAAKITEVLTQAQTQAKILKMGLDTYGTAASDDSLEADYKAPTTPITTTTTAQKDSEAGRDEDDMTVSEGFTFSEDFSLPSALQRRLEELHVKDLCTKGTLVDDFLTQDPDADDEEDSVLENHDFQPVIDQPEKVIQDKAVRVETPIDTEDDQPLEELSDLAQRDEAGDSMDENHSGASETGADISELHTFADEGRSPSVPLEPLPVIDETTPEVKYSANQGVCSDSRVTLLTEDEMYPGQLLNTPGVEQATQTEAAKKLSVMDLQTTYQLKPFSDNQDNCQLDKIHEIILDATVPMDTQLLVQEAQMGSRPAENIELESTDNDSTPCVVTSHVSLAFVGLEQNDRSDSPLTLIIPEQRGLTASTIQPRNITPDIIVEESNDKETQSTQTKVDEIQTDVNSVITNKRSDGEATTAADIKVLTEIANKSTEQLTQHETVDVPQISTKDETTEPQSSELIEPPRPADGGAQETGRGIEEKSKAPEMPKQEAATPSKINLEDYGSEEDESDDESEVPKKILRSKTNPNEVLQIIERPGQPRTYRKIIYVEETDSEEEVQIVKPSSDTAVQRQESTNEARLDKTGSLESMDLDQEICTNGDNVSLGAAIEPFRPVSPVPPTLLGDASPEPGCSTSANAKATNLIANPLVLEAADELAKKTTQAAMNKLSEIAQSRIAQSTEDRKSEVGAPLTQSMGPAMEQYEMLSKDLEAASQAISTSDNS